MRSTPLLRRPAARAAALVALTAALFSGVSAPAIAATASLDCPATVRLTSPRAEAAGLPAGTEIVLDQRPLRLTGHNVFDGPPAQGAVLMPQSDKPGKGGATAVWNFEGDYPQGKFLACDYAGGAVRVVQRVDDAVKRCTARSSTTKNPATLQTRFQCE
ncbi:STY0301 family protein [Acidovorax sp. BLS4]|uniref:STY0301 family protein n=1 Tax=Acidovorax sp. BLS4 TaxID=3273430 RepID=UPI00294259AC|nr:STY0301 family protein [Paracidovorax avenae]WOI46247.1 STY0301 family protein [Paracidovorax avenae]